MSAYQRLIIEEVGGVTVVRFADKKIIDPEVIEQLGGELLALVDRDRRKNILLNFSSVDFLNSATLNKLISLEKRVRSSSGRMKISDLRPELREVMSITRLDKLFDIRGTQAEAMQAFETP